MLHVGMSRCPKAVVWLTFLIQAGVIAIGSAEDTTDIKNVAQQFLDRTGMQQGICVLIATEPADLGLELARRSELTLYVQVPDQASAAKMRRSVDETGLLGTRIYVERGDWSHIHLASNLADVVVVTEQAAAKFRGRQEELLRIVRPLGKVLFEDHEIIKPYPKEADDWTHAYHGPDNNPQSTDQLARAPYITQFLAEPYYVPFPEVTVTSMGRIFKAFGHVGYKERDWPWINRLVAFNGYNGTILWKRSLEEGFNIHRNTMVATPDVLYLADNKSCKLLDTATGKLLDEISAPEDATGPVWKWMALVDGILYALVGEEEYRDETIRGDRTAAGWPWHPMTSGYDRGGDVWGFGRTLFAVDLKTKKVLWKHDEEKEIDGRAITMKGSRIYYYSHPNFLACRETQHGKLVWKNTDSSLLSAIGPHEKAQTARLGFASTAYMKCSDQAVYFAGPQRPRLVAASTEDGKLLWQLPHGNYQIVLRDEGLYAMGRTGPSRLLDPMTGEVRSYLNCVRGNCTRVTGTVDSVFGRGHDHAGTLRLTVPEHEPRRIALMRPDCHDGVIAAGGLVYWGPWMCDCSLSLVGNICLAPAGDFQFGAKAVEAERLETTADVPKNLKPLPIAPGDWPTYRANNTRTATSSTQISTEVKLAWQFEPPKGVDSTAPVAVAGMVFFGGSDGVVRSLDADSGRQLWKAYTAGPILFPPTIDQNRLFAGSGDGWIYAFEAATGQRLWRFRAAPANRKISTYGRLTSTWPVASGVLAEGDAVYAAAGIASYDGTHVYALDAATGRIRWQNNTSGHFFGSDRVTGVSVQGHLLLHKDRLHLAGGNVISPAIYDTKNGRCLNELVDEWGGQKPPADPNWEYTQEVRAEEARQKRWGKAPRGCELFLVDETVQVFDRLLYSPKQYWAGRYFSGGFIQAGPKDASVRVIRDHLIRIAPHSAPLKPGAPIRSRWNVKCIDQARAIAVGSNAIIVAGQSSQSSDVTSHGLVTAHSLNDGRTLWSQPVQAVPTWWGVAIDRAGRVITTLQDGSVACLKPSD
jgi:outer membrane protein assembly factor BamB